MKNYVVFFENDLRGDGLDSIGPYIIPLDDEVVNLLKSNPDIKLLDEDEIEELEDGDEKTLSSLLHSVYYEGRYNTEYPVEVYGEIHCYFSTE